MLCRLLSKTSASTRMNDFSLELLLARWVGLQRFNQLVMNALPLIDLRRALSSGTISCLLKDFLQSSL
jgi:hypothetical protein